MVKPEEYGIDYPEWYPKLDLLKVRLILDHCKRFEIEPDICAYYEDWDDFCSDWCGEIGYTEDEARERLYEEDGEFMIFNDWGIIRFVL